MLAYFRDYAISVIYNTYRCTFCPLYTVQRTKGLISKMCIVHCASRLLKNCQIFRRVFLHIYFRRVSIVLLLKWFYTAFNRSKTNNVCFVITQYVHSRNNYSMIWGVLKYNFFCYSSHTSILTINVPVVPV